MKLLTCERYPGYLESIELVADIGDRFEMSVLKLLLNKELLLMENDEGAYSIIALPSTPKMAKQLGKMKTMRRHLDPELYGPAVEK